MTTRTVLCDTDTLFHNIRDEKSENERQALKKLLEMRASGQLVLRRSQVNRVEVANTKNKGQGAETLAVPYFKGANGHPAQAVRLLQYRETRRPSIATAS